MLKWLPNPRHDPVPGNVTGSVSDEHDDPRGLLPPADLLLAEQDLHQTVQSGLRRVPVVLSL